MSLPLKQNIPKVYLWDVLYMEFTIDYIISKAIFIILVNDVWRSSAEQAVWCTNESEIVQMHKALLPARAAFI